MINGSAQFINTPYGWKCTEFYSNPDWVQFKLNAHLHYGRFLVLQGNFKQRVKPGFCARPDRLIQWSTK